MLRGMARASKRIEYKSTEDFRPVVRSLVQESDRGAVLVAGAAVDDALEQLLRAVLVSGAEKHLLGSRDPLGTFSAKINTCYAFGLLSKSDFSALHTIRKIRNKAAHVASQQDFEVSSFRDAINALPTRGRIEDIGDPVRSRLLWATAGLVARIGNRAHRMKRKAAPGKT